MINEYTRFYNTSCRQLLDTRDFKFIYSRIKQYMETEECPCEQKILFGEWIFSRIYTMYRLSLEDFNFFIHNLYQPINDCSNLILKASYLNFINFDAVMELASYFYVHRFEDSYFIVQMLNDVKLLQSIIYWDRYSKEELKYHFINWFNKCENYDSKSNLLDVLLQHYPKDIDVVNIKEQMRFDSDSNTKDIYSDKQNVHDDKITEQVSEAASNLIEWGVENVPIDFLEEQNITIDKWIHNILFLECKDIFKNRSEELKIPESELNETIHKIYTRITIDYQIFYHKKNSYRIIDVFYYLIHYIEQSEHKCELYTILLEEFFMMKDLCSSGYVARLINVLQGFDDRFYIQLSFEKQLYAALSHKLSKHFTEVDTDVIYGITDPSYANDYCSFIKTHINTYINEFTQSYTINDIYNILPIVLKMFVEYDFVTWKIEIINHNITVDYLIG